MHPEANEIRLRDSKTGPRVVPLSPAAARVLAGLPRPAETPWVIAGRRPGTRLTHIHHHWYRVRERAGLGDVRIHDLRHSFASRALALGESLPMIGKLLGHSKIRTTARYAHLARDSVKVSAARVAASIGADMSPEGCGADLRAAARPRRRRPRDGT
ncbi:MAG: site-specific integrase [Rhodospirillales bacterium]|nr:site-specific integrase [Rhodospirillales bacterium]